ncbi:DUF6680 family protein [Microvirga flavescens]|uniref:DUF6680 family protein n=1 Tax=Microvirga flavescens TaxID=2249811 RepID=UPI0013004580|nr:DUF6680 family protein [Microvirga flavescens]
MLEQFLQEYGTLVTSILSVVATALAAVATYRAPVIAAEVSEKMRSANSREEERRRTRLLVFFTLMQERATIASPLAVQALNSIDAVFDDCKDVREAWADLYHAFGQTNSIPWPLVEDKIRELLRTMAAALGLSASLKRDDFSRTYYPTALAEENYIKNLERAAAKQRLEQSMLSPVANTAPNFGDSAA